MKLIERDDNSNLQIEVTQEEFVMILNSMNEVCNGIDVYEFDTRIGASIEDVKLLLKEMNGILK